MQFERIYCSNWRVQWVHETADGMTLLVVRDRHPLRWWWRLRRGNKNIAKGNAASTRDGIARVKRAMREHIPDEVTP